MWVNHAVSPERLSLLISGDAEDRRGREFVAAPVNSHHVSHAKCTKKKVGY
jgi:hypothetical protein